MSLSAVLLNGLVALPFAFAVLTRLLDRRGSDSLGVAVLGGALTFAWSVWAYVDSSAVLDGTAVDHPWIAELGVRWHLGLDGISGPLVLMSTLVVALCLVSLVRHDPGCGARGDLAALLLLIEAGVLGSFLALDLVLFFAFFEVALIPMWFVINGLGRPARRARPDPRRDPVPGVHGPRVGADAGRLRAGPVAGRHLRHRADRRDVPALGRGRRHRRGARRPRPGGQDAAVAAAHLAARRALQGADGRLGRARRGAAQARHLRPGPVLAAGGRPVTGGCWRRSSPGSPSSASCTPRWPASRRPSSSG